MIDIKQAHDAVFQNSLADIIVAKAFFATHLPIHILEAINLDTLSSCGENFITKNLKKYSSDLIYKVCFKTSNNVNDQGVLYLLTEHESGVNPIIPIKLYNYINLIIQKHLKQHRNKKVLPLVYSIVYYTGKKPYFSLDSFFARFPNIELAKQLFNISYTLVNLQTFSNQQLIDSHKIINLLEYVPKNIYVKDFFVDNKELINLLKKINILEYKEAIIEYLLCKANCRDMVKFKEQLANCEQTFNGGNIVGTVAEYFLEEGMQQGMQFGREEEAKVIASRMLQDHLDPILVAKFTGLNVSDLTKLDIK